MGLEIVEWFKTVTAAPQSLARGRAEAGQHLGVMRLAIGANHIGVIS